MGHSSVVVTERYAHLKPELFRAADYELLNVDLAGEGQVAESSGASYVEATDTQTMAPREVAIA